MAVKVKLNPGGVRKLLKDPKMQADLERRARNMAAAAGDGHEVEGSPTGQRARAVVITATYEARRAEATRRSLTRAIDAGRR